MIFVDTSAIYAWVNAADSNHRRVVASLAAALEAGEDFLTHNYVLVESAVLLRRRLGWTAVRRFLHDAAVFQVRWIDEALHRAALDRFVRRRGRVSLVDEVSFLVMRERGISEALVFDQDFLREGFRYYRA
ncbi:MAG: PIN domain-containing protein [Armatimonadota bacterium]|nr:PIN domain-containing protein [Armatimonadota bacterium]MDR7452056.1 PIN domain-containing protein [Armatimonadota bacterium]MDR7466518.1 PIN domain-containing protein [Armatimonadota bacterium]MDR7493240.1 PIN domain-containing protein [Armatimonadota bacterium]MDR7500588.1 PIN domain-containing protein [Armatimonadota bacterium]